MRAPPRLSLALVAAALLACSEAPPAEPSLRVSWAAATGPQAGLPPDVDALTVRVLDPGGDPPERDVQLARDDLTDDTPWGVVGGIPVGRPVEVRIEGLAGQRVAYTGVVGPFVLRPGERRYVDLLLVPTAAVTEVAHLDDPRAMHTATTLADGRILFAGGFRVAAEVVCTGLPPGSRCFDLTATTAAAIYDPGTGKLYPVRVAMGQPRAAHAATLLPDGRVLVTGGVSAAQLAFIAQPDGELLPSLRVAEGQATASTEVFEPDRDPERDDVSSDGDPGRGGFVAGAEMAYARAQHTATLLPSGEAVLVAGGNGAEDTAELWQDEAWSDAGTLEVSRRAHVAVAMAEPPSVWLLGGAIGADALADIAAVYTIADDGVSGTWATLGSLEIADGGPNTGASLNLSSAGALLLGERTAAVFGWIGPVCDAGGVPAWAGDACRPDDRAFAIDLVALRGAQPVGRAGERHAMGAVVATPDGGGFAIGGFSDLVPTASSQIERLTGDVDIVAVQPEVDTALTISLGAPRALLAGASQTDGAVVVSGGLSLGDGGLAISDLVEVINPAR